MNIDSIYAKLAAIDPVTEAEKTGAADIGLEALAIQVAKTRTEERMLTSMGDTHFSNTEAEYTAIACAAGFEVAGPAFPVSYVNWRGVQCEERMVVLAHRELGLVIVYNTYTPARGSDEEHEPVRVNRSDMYFALKLDDVNSGHKLRCGGGQESPSEPHWRVNEKYFTQQEDGSYKSSFPDDLILMGDFSGQEALLYRMRQLQSLGTLHPVWPNIRRNFAMYFTCEQDYSAIPGHTKEARAQRDALAEQRFKTLPDWCKAIFNGNAF